MYVYIHIFCGEGNGTRLQCSCLQNPRDGGAWRAAVCGVAQSRTRLKRLSSSSSSIYLLYPFICQWTVWLFPCPGYYKLSYNGHQIACIFSNYGFLQIYTQEWDCSNSSFSFLRNLHTVLHSGCSNLHTIVHEGSLQGFSLNAQIME